MKGKNGQVMVGTPTISGDVWFDYMNSYVHSIVMAANAGWSVQGNGMSWNSLINAARAIIGQDFMDSDCDALFFIDSDLSWEPEAFVRLLDAPYEFIAGAYPVKEDNAEDRFHIRRTSTEDVDPNKKIVVETTRCAGGFIRLKRSVMEKMIEAYPQLRAHYRGRDISMLWDPMVVNGVPLGEDFSFCERWTRIEGKIYVDPDITFRHYGRKYWEGNFLKEGIFNEKPKDSNQWQRF